MSSAIGDVREDDCKHGYPPRLCLACKTAAGPKGNLPTERTDDAR